MIKKMRNLKLQIGRKFPNFLIIQKKKEQLMKIFSP